MGIESKLSDSSTATNGEWIVSLLIILCSLRRFDAWFSSCIKMLNKYRTKVSGSPEFNLSEYNRFGVKLEPKYMAQGQDRITRTTNFDLAYYARQAILLSQIFTFFNGHPFD